MKLGFTDSQIALGYLGGFVARASTVAISLFIPLFVNTFYFENGFCQGSPNDPSPELKKECRQAYVLAAILTGVAQLVGLLCAPVFGYLSSNARDINVPIIIATSFGIVGYVAFPQLSSPELKDQDGRGGSPAVLLLAALIGISQIGAIVCSLGSLGRGVLKADIPNGDGGAATTATTYGAEGADNDEAIGAFDEPDAPDDSAPLLGESATTIVTAESGDGASRVRLKGSIAGMYSWFGGAAILILTKLGGYLFDVWSPGTPFYMMAVFNGILLVASVGIDLGHAVQKRRLRDQGQGF